MSPLTVLEGSIQVDKNVFRAEGTLESGGPGPGKHSYGDGRGDDWRHYQAMKALSSECPLQAAGL